MNIDWFMLIIPAVAVGIWAVKTAMEKGAEANRPMPPQGRPVNRPQSASAEIDRFLEEVNRRRQEQQLRQARRPAEPPSRAIEVQVEAPAPRPRPVVRLREKLRRHAYFFFVGALPEVISGNGPLREALARFTFARFGNGEMPIRVHDSVWASWPGRRQAT